MKILKYLLKSTEVAVRNRHATLALAALFVLATSTRVHADPDPLVAETRATSLKQREDVLRKTISKDTCWPGGVWGETLWTLAALRLNEKTDDANARLLKRARDYIDLHRNGEAATVFIPEDAP